MPSEPFAACEHMLHEGDPDRWLACRVLPPEKAHAVAALYAFNLEVARIREIVSEPLPGEIRLQWWRDALQGQGHGDVRANPVAAALLDVIATYRLPLKPFLDLVDARTGDLYDDSPLTLTDLEGYCGETSSSLIRLASLVLADGADAGPASIAGTAGVAYALAGLLRAFPWHASQGRVLLPKDLMDKHGVAHNAVLAGQSSPGLIAALAEVRNLAWLRLDETRSAFKSVPKPIRTAYAPVALVGPWLKALDRAAHEPFGSVVDIAPWKKPLLIWRAAALGVV